MSFKGRLICIVILARLLMGCVTCHKFLTCSELISLSIKWRLVVSTSLNNVIYVKHLEECLIHSRCSITINISYAISSSSYYFKLFLHTHTHTVPPPVDFGSSLLLFHCFSLSRTSARCNMIF